MRKRRVSPRFCGSDPSETMLIAQKGKICFRVWKKEKSNRLKKAQEGNWGWGGRE